MSDLVPEKRLDRLGRLVTKWIKRDKGETVRLAQLRGIVPTIASTPGASASERLKDAKERDTIGAELLPILKRDMEQRSWALPESYRDRKVEDKRVAHIFDEMMGLETATLRIIRDYHRDNSSNLLFQMEGMSGGDEIGFREELHYSEVVERGVPHQRSLSAVKKALVIDDLSQFDKGSEGYLMARAMLEIVLTDERSQSGRKYESRYASARESSLAELGKIMKEYPTRSDAIIDYIGARSLLIREIDHELLREYLDTPAAALSEGML